MLRGLQHAFEDVSNERSANVLIICSSIPKVFCAGTDLKHIFLLASASSERLCNSSCFKFAVEVSVPLRMTFQ
ncbi:hypothetical protein CQW23_34123 [Capsicum baccatum]|uniref:Uncharacterized protein n=1 Tax=Capsicum baccatum TaxID=33114 RepID=A0A2G2UZR7_CAPBA|nr:hypothetical protein CQW23_34123 [Capsicum baccatum]